ncbi:MAG: type IX secretion system sortase PorU [Bacteroidales bacterium]|nr:type IX secretion system sortase PorU [Bacteroidales bacterium]
MKCKFALLYLFIVATFSVYAQPIESSTAYNLNWQGGQKWYANTFSKSVIAFEGAVYPNENQLPYFNQRFPAEPSFSYIVSIENPVYVNLSADESLLLPGNADLNENPQIETQILKERGNSLLDITVFPFVKRSGQILKLKSFVLKTEKSNTPQKMQAATRHTYAANSVLANGKFVKIKIVNSGVYKLTFEDLNSMGISPASVRIFGYGGAVLEQSFLIAKTDDLPELSIYMEKGSDGVFNAGDYILFYAQGVNKWSYDKSKGMFTHVINPYSSYGYYFVTSDAGTGRKIETKTTTLPDNPTVLPVDEFIDYNVYEKESVSLCLSGKEFYGDIFNERTNVDISFNFPNPVLTNSTKVRMDVAASSSVSSAFELNLAGGQTKTLRLGGISDTDEYTKGIGATGTYTFLPEKEVFTFNLKYIKPTSISTGYLNYLEINTRRYLKMSGSVMQFQNVDYLGMNGFNQYRLSDADAKVQIWDITDPQNTYQMPTQMVNGRLTFTDSNNEVKNYLAIDPTASGVFSKPEIVGVVSNQNLHALPPVDMVILTHPNFLSQAETLAQAHREIDQLTVAVVTTEQVYNEFSSGAPDATAYRWIMKMLYDRALASGNISDMPKYLLLFGRGTFDNRRLWPAMSGENLILTYQDENSLVQTLSYVTDDYFGFLDDNEGTQIPGHLLDIGVGRFPVSTKEEATTVVEKTINYMKNTKKGIWKNQLCFLADDGDAALHMRDADNITTILGRNYPAYQINKIYLDSYLQEVSASGETYPLARTQFHDLLRNGLFLLDYTGHAGAAGWTDELILTVNDVKSLTNQQLPLWVGATCNFLQFDVKAVSAGEQVVLNPYGGGIGIFSAARPVYASENYTINRLFCDYLFKKNNGKHNRIGDAIVSAKNNIGYEINKLCYVYMGDPALKMNYPTTYNVKTMAINDNVEGNDTLRAMSVVNIKGIIADEAGNKVENFNGELSIVIYDKIQTIKALDNHKDFFNPEKPEEWDSKKFKFNYRPNILFSGKAVVTNGEYSFTFMLPKDIKYNYGGGRINYYAYDGSTDAEAQGYFESFVVGGTNPDIVNETDGPEMNLYLNSENFVSGDQVNESPLFIANINDINGINRVGSGIGHDLLLTIDNDPSQSIVLNDYFQSAANSYTNGVVKYKLSDLENGKHTLTFKAWDLLNNSSTQALDFEVVKGLSPNIFKVYNYPNPVKTGTTIVVEHDRPETILNTTVDIFDLSGRRIWWFNQSNADEVSWDMIGNDGIKVKQGIYLYRVSINTNNSDIESKTNKMLIIE